MKYYIIRALSTACLPFLRSVKIVSVLIMYSVMLSLKSFLSEINALYSDRESWVFLFLRSDCIIFLELSSSEASLIISNKLLSSKNCTSSVLASSFV